jgi:hypothetical protein
VALALAATAASDASAATQGVRDAVSAAFVGPDGPRAWPLIVAGVVGALIVLSVIVRLVNKSPTAGASATALSVEPRAAAPAAPSVKSTPASVATKPEARPAVEASTRPSAPTPAPTPAPTLPTMPPAAPKTAPRVVSSSGPLIVVDKPAIRKLPLVTDLKNRGLALRPDAPRPASKLVFERWGVVAHVQKAKRIDDMESAKRRPTTVPPGRRVTSLRTSSS